MGEADLFSVSVIVPTYNSGTYLNDTMDSLLNQTHCPLEILAIDNGSSDNTLNILNDYKKRFKCEFTIYSLPCNQGAAYARNYGISQASGRWILFMDSDDVAEPELIEKEIAALMRMKSENNGKWPLAHSAYRQINCKGNFIGSAIKWKQVGEEEILGYEFVRNNISTSGVLADKEVLEKSGMFNINFKYSEDWDLWLRIAKNGGFAYVDEPIVRVRRHENNLSKCMSDMLAGENAVLKQYSTEYIEEAVLRRALPFHVNLTDYVSILFRIGYWEEGVQRIYCELNRIKEYYGLFFLLGLYHIQKNNLEKAKYCFEKTIELKPEHGAALNNLGAIESLLGDINIGTNYFYKALELYNDYFDARFNFSLIQKGSSFQRDDLKFTWRELRSSLLSYNSENKELDIQGGSIMKGIILAGGTGSRLYPLTKVTNKHLLPVGKHPMIEHLIAKMKQAGISDIMVITGKEHMGAVVNLLGSGHDYGVKFTYRIQDQPGGIAQALGLCEEFVFDDKCLVILGDNIFEDDISDYAGNFVEQERGAKILIKKVPDPQRYGVAELMGGNIIGIEEKPKIPKSDYCVTGIYMYDNRVFNIIKTLKPSNRGELEITDVNNWYIKDGSLTFDMLEGWWTDAGTFSSFAYANELSKDIDLDRILCRNYELMREVAVTKE